MNNFVIKSITGQIHDTGFGGYPFKVIAMVEVSSKYYNTLKKFKGSSKRDLGSLVLDINNAVYAINTNIPAHYPSIDSNGSRNAKNGIKTMEFVYFFKSSIQAELLGFEIMKLKNGECIPKYGQYINIYRHEVTK